MGRKVYITSDMSIDEQLSEVAEADPEAALLWPWIITFFDDWGRALASPRRIKAAVFPSIHTVTVEKVETALQLYARVGLIVLYEVDGRRYMAVPHDKWFKYQTHIRREKRADDSGSQFPPPPDGDAKKYDHAGGDAQYRDGARDCAQVREVERSRTPSPSLSPSLSKSMHACMQNTLDTQELEGTAEDPEPAANPIVTAEEELDIGAKEPDIDPRTSVVIAACEMAFGRRLGPLQEQKLLAYLDDGIEVEAVEYALRKAGEAGKDFKYADGILSSWLQKGIRTLEAAKREAEEFRRLMAQTRAGPPNGGQSTTKQGGMNRGRDRPSDRERLEQEYAFWNDLSL